MGERNSNPSFCLSRVLEIVGWMGAWVLDLRHVIDKPGRKAYRHAIVGIDWLAQKYKLAAPQ